MEGGDILQLAKDLYQAPFALLFHDRFVSEEPKFLYANQVRPSCTGQDSANSS